jgi:AbrB family looped-hinge helix DNA binding protein
MEPSINKTTTSYRVSVQRRNLITIPKEIREKLNISEGDVLDIHIDNNKIVIEPYKLVPSSQAYFWTKKAQSDLFEAKEDDKAGRVREFATVDEFIKGIENE